MTLVCYDYPTWYNILCCEVVGIATDPTSTLYIAGISLLIILMIYVLHLLMHIFHLEVVLSLITGKL